MQGQTQRDSETITRIIQLYADADAVEGTSLADLDLREFRELYQRRTKERLILRK